MEGEVVVYRTRDVEIAWRSARQLYEAAEFRGALNTRFRQGELGDCWLVAAVESLRHDPQSLDHVAQDERTFTFWEPPDNPRTITLQDDAVPCGQDGGPLFMRCSGGAEVWGLLLEKAYAKWLQSYEDLEGGYWSDAVQSFTGGGVIERIKMKHRPDNLLEVMLNSFNAGSLLCAIRKMSDGNLPEMFHSCCCIEVMEPDDEGFCQISVLDPSSLEYQTLSSEEFVNMFHRVDICHKNLNHLSALLNRTIADSEWTKQCFQLHEDDNAFSIDLTEPDQVGDNCTFVVEVIQKLKPDEGAVVDDFAPTPWTTLIKCVLSIDEETPHTIKFPQETYVFSLPPGEHILNVTDVSAASPRVFLRVSSKKNYTVTPQD